MVNVLLYCERAGITALPIHDCVIVAASKEGAVKDLMELTAMKVVERAIPVGPVREEGEEEIGMAGRSRELSQAF
jgi:hypothetical protein